MIGMTTLFAMLAAAIGPVVGKTGTAERKAKRRPVGSELRNSADFHQSNALEAAALKRKRRADSAEHYAIRSFVFNNAHRNSPHAPSLDPTYVAK